MCGQRYDGCLAMGGEHQLDSWPQVTLRVKKLPDLILMVTADQEVYHSLKQKQNGSCLLRLCLLGPGDRDAVCLDERKK